MYILWCLVLVPTPQGLSNFFFKKNAKLAHSHRLEKCFLWAKGWWKHWWTSSNGTTKFIFSPAHFLKWVACKKGTFFPRFVSDICYTGEKSKTNSVKDAQNKSEKHMWMLHLSICNKNKPTSQSKHHNFFLKNKYPRGINSGLSLLPLSYTVIFSARPTGTKVQFSVCFQAVAQETVKSLFQHIYIHYNPNICLKDYFFYVEFFMYRLIKHVCCDRPENTEEGNNSCRFIFQVKIFAFKHLCTVPSKTTWKSLWFLWSHFSMIHESSNKLHIFLQMKISLNCRGWKRTEQSLQDSLIWGDLHS